MPDRTCSIDGCTKPHLARGLCSSHYQRWWKHGNALAPLARARDGEPLAFVQVAANHHGTDCLLWPYRRTRAGYGVVTVDGQVTTAHRAVLMLHAGPPPDASMQAAHAPFICSDRACVNPAHLRWATVTSNAQDRIIEGTQPRGANQGGAKLTDAQVLAIRADQRPAAAIAHAYGVSKGTITDIWRRRNWRHL